MTIGDWLEASCADADRRGIPELKPLLASLAEATKALRSADWEEAGRAADEAAPPVPPAPPAPPTPPEQGAAR
jgi:hypothetical protein